ncbi:hypothetical protein SAMN05216490_2741 [Mucilaginibacter mallensis]|uniref:Uncharacterized protein n=1 Tax=Mucilaginibacter mallensis TaxID=652787 RepID=A0A1H1YHQ2_MUCMA|nr:hypothetical protein [Mucilaginibacter mallensis]SDT20914.1 hypothetical protein SAMN05216490_2741 [Mucilaginibacter mallensis]
MKKSLLIIISVFSILFIGFIIAGNNARKAIEADQLKNLKQVPKEYEQILNHDDRLLLQHSTYSKTRNPVSEFTYDKKYRIILYKIGIIDKLKLKASIQGNQYIDTGNPLGGYHVFTAIDEESPFEIHYRMGIPDSIKEVLLTLSGNKTHVIEKNDSIAYYHSDFKYFSIQNDKDSPLDFYGKMREKTDNISLPLEIIFVKRNHNLYLVVLSVIDKNVKVNEGMLYSLLKKN